jgi:hypothetical protein
MLTQRPKINPRFFPALANFSTIIGSALASTWRIERIGYENVTESIREGEKPVFAFWHRDIIPLMFMHTKLGLSIIVSPSRDGDFLSHVLVKLGYSLIRGSSRRGGYRALFDSVKEGRGILGTAVDGPLGPAFSVKPGIPFIAKYLKSPIICGVCAFNRKVSLKTWDKTCIPLPFSRGVFAYSEPLHLLDIDIREAAKITEEALFTLDSIASGRFK